MVLALIVLVVILFMVVKGFSDPFMALFAFITAYELQPGELYPALGVLHLERVLLLFILIVFFAKKIPLRFPPITKNFLYFFGAMLLSTIFAFWRANSFEWDLSFLEIVIYHLLLVSMLDSEDRIRKYLLLYVGLIGWIGLSSMYEYHMGVRLFRMGIYRAEGLTSAGGDPDTMAITMVITLPLAAMLMGKGNSKWVKLYGLVIFGIYLATIINTGSRTAFLAFLFCIMLAVFRKPKNLKYIPIIVLALPLLWTVIPRQYRDRYKTVETRDQDASYTNRLLSWQGGMKMFLHNPITGIGPNDYTYANGMKYWPGNPRHWLNAHSLYFKLLGELGIIGFVSFFMYLISVIRANYYLARRFKKEMLDPIVMKFPSACNLSLYLLLFTGYAAHNTYRSNWYTVGAVTAAIALLKPKGDILQTAEQQSPVRLPAWAPARHVPQKETVGA